MQHIYAADKNGELREVSPELRDTLIASGKRQAADFNVMDDGAPTNPLQQSPTDAPQPSSNDSPVSVVTGLPRAPGDEGVTTLEPISGDYMSQVNQTLFPNRTAAFASGEGAGPQALGWLRDVGSLPGRTVLGAGSGVGAFLGSDGSLLDRAAQGAQMMQAVMGTPTGTPVYRGNSLGDKVSNALAGIVTDPSLPLAAGTSGLGAMAGKMFSSPVLSAAARAITQGAAGAGEGTLSSPGNEGLGALVSGTMGLGAGGLSEAGSALGNKLQGSAKALLTSQVKPAQIVKGGQEARGLQTFLDAGGLPQVTGPFTLSVPGIARNFENKFQPIKESFAPVLSGLDARGVTVSVPQGMQAMEQGLNEAKNVNPKALSIGDLQNAAQWAEERLPNPGEVGQGIWDIAPSTPLELPASLGHSTKSAMLDAAFKDPSQETARGVAAMDLGQNFRTQLMQQPEYANLMQNSAPYYAAEASMKRAATKANRNPVSFSTALHPILAAQETPATAWGLWQAGRALPTLGNLVGGMAPYLAPVTGGVLTGAQSGGQ